MTLTNKKANKKSNIIQNNFKEKTNSSKQCK